MPITRLRGKARADCQKFEHFHCNGFGQGANGVVRGPDIGQLAVCHPWVSGACRAGVAGYSGGVQRDGQVDAAAGDRERRARLEALQAELAQVRAALPGARGAAEAAVTALEDAVGRERARRDALLERAAELERRADAARRALVGLKERLREAHVLALGASRRDTYVEWASEQHGQVKGPDPSVFLLAVPLLGVAGLLLALMVHGCLQ